MDERDLDDAPGEPGDRTFMARALELARRGLGLAAPNPMVGAVLVRDGRIVGEGWHEGPGTDHAEVAALRRAGELARGATLYVTLEPCSHQGRTPPCAPAVAAAGVARLVAAARDPNPTVDGRGFAVLREAGVRVEAGVGAPEGRDLIAGFAKHVRSGLPFVTLKTASSLDGKAAARDGSSRWITGEAARRDAHELRAEAGAVAAGAGTVLADDPSLTVRLEGYRGRQPVRVVVDASGRTPGGGRVHDGAARTVVATTVRAPGPARAAWEDAGAEVLVLPESPEGVALDALLEALGKRDVQGLLVEGGPTLAWSFLRAGLIDRWVAYVGARALGGAGAMPAVGGDGVPSIGEAIPLHIESVERLGEDVKVVARVHGDR